MPFKLFGGGNERDSGEPRRYGDLSERELRLLDEADWAQAGEPFNDSNVFFHAFPDEGTVYIHENQGDDFNCTFSYGDASQATDALLTQLNSDWND